MIKKKDRPSQIKKTPKKQETNPKMVGARSSTALPIFEKKTTKKKGKRK